MVRRRPPRSRDTNVAVRPRATRADWCVEISRWLCADVAIGCERAHRLRYDSTSPTAATVWHGRSSGDDARWSDIAYSDVVRVGGPTQDSTIGLAQDQRQARRRTDERRRNRLDTIVAYIGLDWADERHSVHLQTAAGMIEHFELEQKPAVLHERVALTNRLTSLLKQYFPQALEWVGDLPSVQACDFLTQWPTLAAVQRARPSTIRQFYRAHNCRKADVIEARLAAIASARPLTTDAAVVEPLSLSVQTYATQLRALIAAIQTFDDRIAQGFAEHADHDAFTSLPGAGDVCAPRLAAAFGTDRSRWDSAAELQAHSGIAPVTERSGKTLWVHHRLACPKFVKQTFHEFADQSIRFSRWARVYYDQQRARGNDHHAALRALAYKWIRILFRCWKERTPYDEDTYIDALRRRGSPLAKKFA